MYQTHLDQYEDLDGCKDGPKMLEQMRNMVTKSIAFCLKMRRNISVKIGTLIQHLIKQRNLNYEKAGKKPSSL